VRAISCGRPNHADLGDSWRSPVFTACNLRPMRQLPEGGQTEMQLVPMQCCAAVASQRWPRPPVTLRPSSRLTICRQRGIGRGLRAAAAVAAVAAFATPVLAVVCARCVCHSGVAVACAARPLWPPCSVRDAVLLWIEPPPPPSGVASVALVAVAALPPMLTPAVPVSLCPRLKSTAAVTFPATLMPPAHPR